MRIVATAIVMLAFAGSALAGAANPGTTTAKGGHKKVAAIISTPHNAGAVATSTGGSMRPVYVGSGIVLLGVVASTGGGGSSSVNPTPNQGGGGTSGTSGTTGT